MRRIVSAVVGMSLVSATNAVAQGFKLTVENIMRGPELYGTPPTMVRFSADGRHVYFRWRAPGADTLDQDYRVAVAGGSPERLPRNAVDTIAMDAGAWDSTGRRLLTVLKGDLYLVERGTKRRLTQTPSPESAPGWSKDGQSVYFTREGNAWALDLTGRLAQLTDIRRGPAPKKPADPAGQKKELRDEQRDLFDFVRRQAAEDRLRADTDTVHTVKPLYLGERETANRLEVSPDGRFVLATIAERARGDSVDGRQVVMPVWVSQSGYVETQQIRTKVGDAQQRQKTALIEVATGHVTWIDEARLKDSLKVGNVTADVAGVAVSRDGRYALLRATATNYEDAWLIVVDLPSKAMRVVAKLHDDAWLGGPLANTAGFLRDGNTVYYGSEESGYAHLYLVPSQGGTARALTSGSWEVLSAELSRDGRTFFIHSNEGDFGQVHYYMLDVAKGTRSALTSAEGRQDVERSPDGTMLAVVHSTANQPPELYLQAARGGAPRKVTDSPAPEFKTYNWIKPEIVMVTARDGAKVPARIYRPAGVPSNRAAVIFVHGAGYLQNVHKWWSQYSREYLFHHLLAARGYTVLDMDYRASAGHGRAWRTAIYRHMGGQDLDDQIDGARWLVKEAGVDSARIGIYGGSYGGFITLMALFTQPDVFAAGAALRPVTDWSHYNHPYTARILNEPQGDTLAYRRSSPIYHAAGLKGRLLICHGMVDDNVHFQDTARLVQRLIELGKEGWEAAMYPVEPHGFRRADSWTDEYKRILKLFEETLR